MCLAKLSQRRQSSKNLFHHKNNKISAMTHGDDFVATEPTAKQNKLAGVYPIETKIISQGSTESIRALNRRLHWEKRGIVYQHDPRHVDVLVKALGLEHGNSVQTPATQDATEEEPEPLDQVQRSRYKSQVATCVFLRQNRAYVTLFVNESCQRMPTPTQQGLEKLKRRVRYLKCERQWEASAQLWKNGRRGDDIVGQRLGGCKETRMSSSAGVILLRSHTLKADTRKQNVITGSSEEAELHTTALGASESKGMLQLFV